MLVTESKRYAGQKNKHDVQIDITDLKVFLGFLFLSGYHTLPRERLYWNQREDFGVEMVKKAMTRDRYLTTFEKRRTCGEQ